LIKVDLLDDADLDTKKKVDSSPVSSSPSPSTSTTHISTTTTSTTTTTTTATANEPAPTPAVQEINMAGLSARERNMLKRKMKLDAKLNKNKEK
jgi:TATA-binding protein-associated factor